MSIGAAPSTPMLIVSADTTFADGVLLTSILENHLGGPGSRGVGLQSRRHSPTLTFIPASFNTEMEGSATESSYLRRITLNESASLATKSTELRSGNAKTEDRKSPRRERTTGWPPSTTSHIRSCFTAALVARSVADTSNSSPGGTSFREHTTSVHEQLVDVDVMRTSALDMFLSLNVCGSEIVGDVISRTIIRSFIEEVRMRCIPVLHGLDWGFTFFAPDPQRS